MTAAVESTIDRARAAALAAVAPHERRVAVTGLTMEGLVTAALGAAEPIWAAAAFALRNADAAAVSAAYESALAELRGRYDRAGAELATVRAQLTEAQRAQSIAAGQATGALIREARYRSHLEAVAAMGYEGPEPEWHKRVRDALG